MSKNFKIGTKVRVKETGEVGVVKSREVIITPLSKKQTIEYVVKFGEGFDNWKTFQKKQLEKIKCDSEKNDDSTQTITCKFTYNKRTIVMVGIVDKIKIDTYKKVFVDLDEENGEVFHSNEGECFLKQVFKGKSLSIGWAISHPDDKFDVFVGEKIALRRAKEHPISVLYSEYNGEFNSDMVAEVLKNKSEYFIENIEKFINK